MQGFLNLVLGYHYNYFFHPENSPLFFYMSRLYTFMQTDLCTLTHATDIFAVQKKFIRK